MEPHPEVVGEPRVLAVLGQFLQFLRFQNRIFDAVFAVIVVFAVFAVFSVFAVPELHIFAKNARTASIRGSGLETDPQEPH